VEALLVIYLALAFGFRPVATKRMNLQAIYLGECGYELFVKVNTAKTIPLRR
jgi:hypothetical protein